MSAITGIFYRDGRKVDPELMKKMNNRLKHRGPDGSAVWCEGPVGLGHQMLWTTPESLHEKLPFHDRKAGLVITADARIDNRKELAEKLDLEDKEDVSDSYFILKAYQKWGEKCPEYLLGDFAFAIWDENEEQLFCARDHMGVKPFYYYLDDDMFVFGTEINALLFKYPICKLNELKLAFFIMFNTHDKKMTFYENILKIEPAHCLLVNKTIKINKYWELDPNIQIIMNSKEDYFKEFRKIFSESIKCRMRCAFPLGFELSGGLDSSSVVCMAKKIYDENNFNNNIETFSYVFDEFPEVDERYYINKIIEKTCITSNFLIGDRISPLNEINDILKNQEQPFYTPNLSIIWNLYKIMNNKNIRVLLGGNGGDEIISHGTYYFKYLARSFQWKKFLLEVYKHSKIFEKSFINLIISNLFLQFVPQVIKNIIRLYKKPNIFSQNGLFILNSKFSVKLGGKRFLNDLKWKPFENARTSRKNHYLSIIADQYVLEMLDKLSSNFLIEPRYPYYDKRIVEYCYSVPEDIKFHDGWNRLLLRKSMTNILPPEIQWRRKKTNFSPVYERNLLIEKEIIEDIFKNENNFINQYFDLEVLKEIYYKFTSGYDSENFFAIWISVLINIWKKLYKINY
ncbi:MAG: lasso peptide isopeptide bond-forming cyclase [Methanobacteriaceae archaeon]|nr:lasso peptide isopeptide bond-forming cyclase [Methanobacteriaceae archaeon]